MSLFLWFSRAALLPLDYETTMLICKAATTGVAELAESKRGVQTLPQSEVHIIISCMQRQSTARSAINNLITCDQPCLRLTSCLRLFLLSVSRRSHTIAAPPLMELKIQVIKNFFDSKWGDFFKCFDQLFVHISKFH